MSTKAKNYTELTDKMLKVFEQISDDKMSLNKANTLVRASNAVINIQRTKILSTGVTPENKMEFFKD
jgi:L-fucose isomerase-like protein